MEPSPPTPARYNSEEDLLGRVPVHVVWEITLACNLKCQHCGSRAGRPRPRELTTAECLDVVRRLAAMGTREITLIGGEAYLRPDWTEIIRAIRHHGIDCAVQTGARNLTDERLAAAVAAGLQGLGVSLDGPPALHDRIRGVPGSYDLAVDALARARAAGLRTSVNTTLGAPTIEHLPELMRRIVAAGATHWQLQLMVAMGNAVDHDELLLQPYQLLDLMPLLARLYHEAVDSGLLMTVGNNIGYFGPHEHLWRSHVGEGVHWSGCTAGQTVMGLESDGTVKGCPSLSTSGYAGGNVREMPLEALWAAGERLRFNDARGVDDLWGFCATCYYADVCRGGCTWTADSLFGRPGNNPYCHYRALELEKRGLRERVVKRRNAPPGAFTTGEFALLTEPIPGRETAPGAAIPPPPRRPRPSRSPGELPPRLDLCRACDCFVRPEETSCPHCAADLATAAAAWAEDSRRRAALVAEVEALMAATAANAIA
ncbi:MAG TPA: GDL motif peptide-associated radical SAM/SPASM maturase [Thermoanaerobaculia bacterium]|nr:GDL motif peptide-associated radical SAM/SPASM maturase [Thermoanaerobaculia bacterium]